MHGYTQEKGCRLPRGPLAWATIGLCGILLLVCVYLPPAFNLNDDAPGHAVFPTKVRDLGGIGIEPFSKRRSFLFGASFPIQAIILSFLPLQHLNISEPALGIALTLLLLSILASGASATPVRVLIGALLLLIACLSGSRMLVNIGPAFLMVPPIYLIMYSVTQPAAAFPSISAYWAALGVAAGYLTCMRITAIPLSGMLLLLTVFYGSRWPIPGWKKQFVKGASAAFIGWALFLLPFSLDMHQSSGVFQPVGHFRLWASPMPVNNVDYLGTLALSAFKDLSLIVTIGGFLLWVRATLPNKDAVKRGCLVLLALLINFVLAGRAVRGVQTSRYVAPLLVAFLLYLISTARLPIGLLRTRSLAGAWVLTVVLLAAAGLFAYRYGSLLADQVHEKLAIRRQALFPSARELREYQHLQQAVPVGATILCSLMRNYLLDFKRNRILVHDLPADFGPAPGWPREYGGPSMGAYLRRNGVEYLAVAPPSLAAAGASPDPFGSELAYRRFEKALAEQPFASSVIYKSEIGRLYRVPGE